MTSLLLSRAKGKSKYIKEASYASEGGSLKRTLSTTGHILI